MQKTKTISFVLVLVLLSTMLLAVMLTCDWGSAQAETSQEKMTSAELFSATNTYDCTVAENYFKDGQEEFNVKYDLSSKNGNQVMNSPQITVLTHGLGGNAADWSNQYDGSSMKFEYDRDSIIEYLMRKKDSEIFRVKMSATFEVEIYNGYSETDKISAIDNGSKHFIIVFEANKPSASNDSVYYEFNHAISNIVLQVKKLNGGILPKLNLIGHSRGGLTNMQYALDHPDLVESLISIGTPYFSSNMANVFGEKFMGKCDGLDDIVNQDVYMGYYNRWNDNYDNLYKDINAVAIGGYSSLSFLPLILTKDKSDLLELSESARIALATFLEGVVIPTIVKLKVENLGESVVFSMLTRGLNAILPDNEVVDMLTLIFSEIGFTYKFPFAAYFGDGLVPLDSQLGIENGIEVVNIHKYKGFKRYKRYFTEFDSDFDRVAEAMPPAAHNLEPRDSKIIQWVCNECNVKNGFGVEKLDSTTVAVTGYYGRFESDTVVVPQQIDGLDVVKIDDNAFGESWFKENMTKIILPASVKSIGESAFADCVALKSVEFDGKSQLTSIGKSAFAGCINLGSLPDIGEVSHIEEGAFAGTAIREVDLSQYPSVNSIGVGAFRECKNLASLNLGNNITDIGDSAFWGCDELTSVNIPQGVVEIGTGAFSNCMALTHIIVDSSNNVYTSLSGILYSKDASVLYQYPAGQAGYMYVVPVGVKTIDDYAFFASSMSDIKLNKDLQKIGKYAFASNKYLPEITVFKEVMDIDSFAFADCTSLTKVTLFNPNANHLSDWAFENVNKNAKFYVAKYALSKECDTDNFNKGDYFVDRFALNDYKDNIYPIEYYIHYYDGDKLIETKEQYYLSRQIARVEKKGYNFSCWNYKGSDTVYNTADCVESEEISLQAKWITKEFVIKFSRDKSSTETEYGYLSIVNGVGDIVMQHTKVAYGAKANELIKDNLMNWYYNEGRYYEGKVLEKFDFYYSVILGPTINLGGGPQDSTQPEQTYLIGPNAEPKDNYDYSAVYAFVESLIDDGVIDFGDCDEIEIKPIFRDKNVDYNFNPNGGQLTGESKSQKSFGTSYSLAIPERWGYSFSGWKIDSITAVSDIYDVSKLPKFTSSNNSYIGNLYNFATVPDLIYKVPFDYSINLVAQWKYAVIDAYSMSGSEISGGNTKWIDFSRYGSTSSVNKTFKVASTISKLYVNNMSLLENVSFDILGDCTLIFEECAFEAPAGKCGIDATGKNLSIISIGTNIIFGGDKASLLQSTMSTYCAGIVASQLTVEARTKANEFLAIYGGKGFDATSEGSNGSIGGVGIKVSSVTFISGIVNIFGGTGGSGAKGIDAENNSSGEGYTGGTGGQGGKGGIGLYFTNSLTVNSGADVTIQGGTGGTGGQGGKGGKGADHKGFNSAKRGGQGGTGGKGGDGGSAVYKPSKKEVDENTVSLFGGQGGTGGLGGEGGDGGKKVTGYASQGASGSKGDPGSYGNDYE